MNTPICDFVKRYAEGDTLRLHMPGHKGKGKTEAYDITEIAGADSLYEADGIIAESEKNASELFGANTFYSAEGSSLCIRAMFYLISLYARKKGRTRPVIAAARNVHKSFVFAAAAVDADIEWIPIKEDDTYLSSSVDTDELGDLIAACGVPDALYVTSPDYLGNTVDIASLSRFCRERGILLAVDNAHGAYLKFLSPSRHPMDLGAHMCSDSAHKTLPVITGGAYLHISRDCDPFFAQNAKRAMAFFGSTSPSYLILQSLDAVNPILAGDYSAELERCISRLDEMKRRLSSHGYVLVGDEPIKLTVDAKKSGYTGAELASLLRGKNIECEFADPDFVVMMFTPSHQDIDIERAEAELMAIPARDAIEAKAPGTYIPKRALSVREALFAPSEVVDVELSLGRVLADVNVACPPAVPILVCGEIIDERAAEL